MNKERLINRLVWVGITMLLCGLIWFIPEYADARPATYVRPYGPNAPWNRPVKDLPKHQQSALYTNNFWSGSSNGDFNLRFIQYTYPVYYASDATTTATVKTSAGNLNGRSIPWNPAWRPAVGTDAQVIILDEAKGYEYNFWQVTGYSGGVVTASSGSLIQTGETATWGSPGNYFTKENGFQNSTRGVGIQTLAMLVQPEEIALGVIRHALSMPITNPSRTLFVAPATKLEHPGVERANPVPEGMRFAINITDAQIDAWVTTKPVAYRKLARTIAVALRDYGWFITDTSGADGWQMEANESARSLWSSMAGIDSTSLTATNLMDGLVTKDRIYALVPSNQYPPVTTPCTVVEETACESAYNSCMAACNQ